MARLLSSLEAIGAVTQGATQEEALNNINEVVQMVVDELIEDGIPVPLNPTMLRSLKACALR